MSGSACPRGGKNVPEVRSTELDPRAEACEWRLPSGQDLISFALAAGLAAGPLLPDLEETEQESEARRLERVSGRRG